MPKLSEVTDNPNDVAVIEEARPSAPMRLSEVTGGDEKQVTFLDDKGIAVEHSALASDTYIKESIGNSVYSKDVYPSISEQDKIPFTEALGAKFYMGLQSASRGIGKLMFLDRIPYFKNQYALQEQDEALVKQYLQKQTGVAKFASDFAEGAGGLVYTLPVDMMTGGATKATLAGKILPNVAKYLARIPNFAIGMGIRGFAQKAEEGKPLEAPLAAAEQTAIGTLYGSVGTGWKAFPKMSALGLAEAHYNALKQNRLATPEESIEGAANGLAFATVFHAIGVIEKGINNVQEKSILQSSYDNIDAALKAGDFDTIKNEYDRIINNEKVSPETKDAIFNAFKDTKESYIENEKNPNQIFNLSKEESGLLESAIAKHSTGEALSPEETSVIKKISTSEQPVNQEALRKEAPESGTKTIISSESITPDATGFTPLRRKIAEMEERKARVEISEDALSEIDTIRQYFKRRITKYRYAYLKEELQGMPSFYITKEGGLKPDEAIDELRNNFGVDVRDEVALKEYLQNLEKSRRDMLAEVKANRPQLVTKSEFTLLNERIKTTGQGIREGRIRTKEEIMKVQTELIEAIEQADLPLDERGKYLRAIKNVQTNADLAREFPDIAKRIQEMKNKQIQTELISQIQKASERAKSSNAIAVEYANLIDAAINEYELKGHREDTIRSLKETKEYIEQAVKEGKDIEMPEDELKKLEILGRKPLKEITNQELEDLLGSVEDLERLGRAKLRLREMANEQKKQHALAEIQRDSAPLLRKEKIKAKVGERLGFIEKLKNQYADARNFAMEKDLAITPMDVVFDMLDGNKQYKGANLRIFKQTLSREFSEYLKVKSEVERPVKELAKKLNLDESNFERIGVYAARMQEGGYDKLLNSGYSEREIELELTPEETKFYELMRDKLETFRPAISGIMRLVYNEPFYAVKNYFPFMTDFEKMSDAEMRSRFGDNVEQYGLAPKKNVSHKFAMKRVGGEQKIQINAMKVFLKHVDNASYFTTVGKETKFLGELAARDEYAASVGDVGQEIVRDWVDLVARKGKIAGEGNNILDTLRKNAGASILAFRLSSTLIQPTSIGNGAALIGNYAFDGAYRIASDRQWRQFVYDNMPQVKFRIGDDPAFLEFGDKSIIDKAEQAGFWALENLDRISAASVAAGAYEKYCKENGIEVDFTKPNPEAIDYAQLIMRRTQSSSFFIDAPSALTRGTFSGKGANPINKSIDKTIFQFQSFMLNDWSMIRHDLWRAGVMEKRMGQAANIFFYLSLVFMSQMGIRAGTKALVNKIFNREPKPDEESIWHKLVDNVVLQQIPFVGNVVQSLDYGSNPIPALEFLNKFMKDFSSVAKSKEADKKIMALARSVLLWIPGGSNLEPLLKVKKEAGKWQ